MDKYSAKATRVLELATQSAMDLGHDYIGSEHLLLAILREGENVVAKALNNQGATEESVENLIKKEIGYRKAVTEMPDMTPRTKRIVQFSLSEALTTGSNLIGTEHIFLAMIKERGSVALKILSLLKISVEKIANEIAIMIGNESYQAPLSKNRESAKTPNLDKFSRDLTNAARGQKFDPIIGRTDEIERVIQILSRRTKNNPCLVGEPGVGKTAIVEGLAQHIVEGDVPETLKGKRLVTLDLSSMVAGAKYRGEFEERIKKIIDEVKAAGNIVLFIDEIHTLIGAGGAEGAMDAANILKPALSRGEIQLIGATTMDEYRKYIEKDAALERRFQPVQVNEPNENETIEILNGIKDKYEAHHKVVITDEAVKAAVKLSVRYITDRFLPDKAIDLIDEACSKVRLECHTSPKDIKALESELEKLNLEKIEAIQIENYEGAAEIKKKTDVIKTQLEAAREDWNNKTASMDQTVTPERIAQIIASWTGIPVVKLAEEEGQRLMKMEETLHKRVIGQDEAVIAVSEAIRRGRVGLKDPKRPVGSFLFLGPTGVGKTELCKALAEVLFGKEDAMIRIDMSEYMEKHSVSRLIGSPPGYVGYDDAPQLSEKVRKKPYSVILFDEIEKAHPDVFNILLQILDDGRITDSHGRIVDFKNTVIIMTSNVGARNITEPKKMGFGISIDDNSKYKDMKHMVMEEVKNSFRPEFLNRIDDIIVFHALNQEHTRQIVTLLTNELTKRIKDSMNITVNVTDAAKDLLGTEGYSPMYGARPLKRLIQTKIENKLAGLILQGTIKPDTTVTIDVKDNELVFN